MLRAFVWLCLISSACVGYPLLAKPLVSNIKADETAIFFNTYGYRDNFNKDLWHIPIHGWIFEPEHSVVRKGFIEKVLKTTFDLKTNAESQPIFDRRVNLFLADNERGKRIIVRLGQFQFSAERSSANGHFYGEMVVSSALTQNLSQHNLLTYCAVLKKDDKRQFCGHSQLIHPHGISVISDIDDTVKTTEVTDHKKMIQNTFYREFSAVPGMAEKYGELSQEHIPIHFVSSSPWHLYPELDHFFRQSEFPFASMSLKYFRFKDTTFLNLFKSGFETKPEQIREILNTYSKRDFVLIGDSGEQDPEVYCKIQSEHPTQIQSIWIRNITSETISNERFQKLGGCATESLHLFSHADEISDLGSGK